MAVAELKDVFDEDLALKHRDSAVVGLDIGSRGTKAVVFYGGRLYYGVTVSGISSQETGESLINELLAEAGIGWESVEYLVGTGYGRVALEFTQVPVKVVTEISCHGMGAHYLNRDVRTIIDIGGQDSKAIKIDADNGKVVDFIMNDKCAAGTGRFLEKVAQILELELDELGEYAVRSKRPCDISSQCVVFAESEVISLKAKGYRKEAIAAGIHFATARRVKNLLKRTGFEDTLLFTGGVSNNQGMVKALEETIGKTIGDTRLDAMYAGAIGAAVFAAEYARELTESYGGQLQ